MANFKQTKKGTHDLPFTRALLSILVNRTDGNAASILQNRAELKSFFFIINPLVVTIIN